MTTSDVHPARRPRLLVLNWRDVRHPEGGGSERYLESVARLLVREHGWDVTLFCAEHELGRGSYDRDGVRMIHSGGRLSVYLRGLAHLRRHRYDVVVDVQNGVPFWSRLATRRPVVVLVHHVHREVWPVAVGPVAARVGWWLESRVAPAFYRRCRYVTVSQATLDDLVGLGVDRERVDVVHNGTEAWSFEDPPRSVRPRLAVVGRLVPHKQVEHAVDVVAALVGRLDVQLDVIGHGYWADRVRAHAESRGVAGRVHLHGYVPDARKHELLGQAWVHVCPSLKEGWGLVCVEAARHGVPTVAYRSAGGVQESVRDGVTGLLVEDLDGLVAATAALLDDERLRTELGTNAVALAREFSWQSTATQWAALLAEATGGVPQRSP